MKLQNVRMHVYKVICIAVKHHGHALAAQINIMQSLQYYEHLSEPMAECLSILAKEFDHAQLGDEILREIAGKTFNAQDTKGPRAFSRFLVKFSEESPRSVLKQISLLLGHLDSEVRSTESHRIHLTSIQSYPMRMAIVEVIGSLIRELATSEDMTNDSNQTYKQLDGLFELLISRTLDLSSYVRSKVLSTLSRMLDLPVRLAKQRLRITRAAVDMLEDKASTVRKASVSILTKLILTHPYGDMYGGDLNLQKWEQRYKDAKEKLQEMEGVVGKAVEKDDDDDDDEEEAVEDEEDAESSRRKSKKCAIFTNWSHLLTYDDIGG